LAAVTAVAVLTRRRFPWLLVGWLWYLGMLVPVIGLAQAGWQSMADRYTYLPHIGISLALVWTVAEFPAGWPFRRLVGGLAAAVLVGAMIVVAWRQTTFWQNSETLWSRALDCTSRNAVAHTGLGKVYQSQGRIAEAVRQYELAIEINPVHLQAHNNLGAILFQQGRLDEAIKHYQAAVRANPNYAKAHGNLGSCYYRQGKVNEAIAEYRLALKIDPNYVDARNNLALVLKAQGSAEKASAP
jgi:tetratricopeptide (TPR) repeat protein